MWTLSSIKRKLKKTSLIKTSLTKTSLTKNVVNQRKKHFFCDTVNPKWYKIFATLSSPWTMEAENSETMTVEAIEWPFLKSQRDHDHDASSPGDNYGIEMKKTCFTKSVIQNDTWHFWNSLPLVTCHISPVAFTRGIFNFPKKNTYVAQGF